MAKGARDVYFDTVKALERRAAALEHIALYARSPAKLEAVLSEILESAMELVGADAGTVYLANPATGQFDFAAARWASLSAAESADREKSLKAAPVKLNEGIVGQVFQNREPVTVPDVTKSAVFRKDVADVAHYEIRNLLAVPLQLDETPLGVLELFNKTPKGVFASSDLELAVSLAHLTALVIDLHRQRAAAKALPTPATKPVEPETPKTNPAAAAELQEARRAVRDAQAQLAETRKLLDAALQVQEQNTRRVKDLGDENERLKAMADAATPPQQMTRLLKSVEPFAFTLSLDRVLKNFMELSARLVNAQAVQVFLWDARAERLSLAASTAAAAGKGVSLAFKKGEGVAGAVAESLEILRVTDVTKEDRFSKSIDEAPGILTRSLLVAPLAAQGRLLGVIELINKKNGGSFLEEDVVGLGGLALMGSAALEKTLLHRELVDAHRSVLGIVADLIETRTALDQGRHERIRALSQALAENLGFREAELRDLDWAALLFNIGLATLPADLTTKKSDLTPAEREALSKVSRVSAAVLNPVPALAEAARLVKHVTERWDGLGDPDRLSAGGIPYGSRVLAVVDAFDALTTGAGGRKTLPPDVALKELESGAGKLFDPACVESFARLYKSGRFKAALNRPK